MPPRRRRRKRRKKNRHLIFILFLIIVGVFLYFEEFEKEKSPKQPTTTAKPDIKPKTVIPGIPPPTALPKVVIIMDDLGQSKQRAMDVFKLNAPITIAILPLRQYSAWIAEEADRRGHDIILHIPMEPTKPLKLGKGGLHVWMSDEEIRETMIGNLDSAPHIKGVSNHMGSAFTQDERGMNIVISELKTRGLFFLDSITTAKSIAYKMAKSRGLKALRRDVFLDDKDDPAEIKKQWDRLIKIAIKNGSAIAQGHPRRNTLNFLKKALKNNDQVVIVPVTELIEP